MKKIILHLLCTLSFIYANEHPIHVLHMTFHHGCKMDIEEMGRELGLDITSWYVQEITPLFWEGIASGNEIYNVGPRRAQRVWDKHKDFFNEFDVIITSDTAPLSRIFLQNNWQKPLIIWVCNRFDYTHGAGGEDRFPDANYYALIRQAATRPNVRIVGYTPYEHEYIRRKGINSGTLTIKPLGSKEKEISNFKSAAPDSVKKEETLFIFPRITPQQVSFVHNHCAQVGLKTWSGVYNGPEDLKQFKGVLFFPYAYSNLALFENLQRGIVHFVPTQRFLLQLGFVWDTSLRNNLNWCEWYFPEYEDLLVFFDSWQDLKNKVDSTDYANLKIKIKIYAAQERDQKLQQWRNLFSELLGF